jgi:peroxiredoxin
MIEYAIGSSLAICMLGVFAVFLLKQQGRLLLRLDELEAKVARSQPSGGCGGDGVVALTRTEGLPVGTPAPPFRLPDLAGNPVSLADFLGKRVLAIHWNPACGFCAAIVPELAQSITELASRNTSVVLISYGTPEENRALIDSHESSCQILLQSPKSALAALFGSLATPAAYLIDESGRIAESLAIGAEEVPRLAREAAGMNVKSLPGRRPLSESLLERRGIPAGTPAPDFELPEVRGGELSLRSYRGKRLLLVFSDPACGPCDQLMAHLAAYSKEPEKPLDLLLVGRGGLEENRRKAKEFSLNFPVVVQRQWEVSRAFGIFATPVAFLIGEDGRTVWDVFKGVEEIQSLLVPSSVAASRG